MAPVAAQGWVAVAAWVAAETKPLVELFQRDPELLQRLLQLELSRRALNPILAAVAEGRDPRTGMSTPTQIENFQSAPLEGLRRALGHGVEVMGVTALGLPGHVADTLPPAYFAWGDLKVARLPRVAIVGTRGASTYGKAAAIKFAEAFARAGLCLVSGGALGIDRAAHSGAIEAGGKTIAVLASGVDQAERDELLTKVRAHGFVMSHYPCGSPGLQHRFLERNDVIAGISRAVVVVEAPERSGALRTARTAVDMNLPVFVVPGDIGRTGFRGSHALIREGAVLVDHPDQVLSDLDLDATPLADPAVDRMTPRQRQIYDVLDGTPWPPEKIAMELGLDAIEVLTDLTMLEVDGLVIRDRAGFSRKL